jgi:MarR family transcriptional regulator, organic hydroperoxide resistance regulator
MFDTEIRRLFDAYPAIYLACHRRHVRDDETGKPLTGHQASILDHLHRTRPLSLSKLAEHMGVGCSAMSIAISKLVKSQYVTRVRAPHDARSIALTLTARGEGIRGNNSFLDHQLVRDMFRRLSSEELDSALRGLEILARGANILLRQRSRTRKT